MKNSWARALGLGLVVVFFAACSAGGDGDDNPPPTIYKYYAYVANYGTNTVSGYSINTTTGAWTAVPGSPFATNAPILPLFVAVDPTGKYAYVPGIGSDADHCYVAAYSIEAASGRLTEISGSPFHEGQCWSIAFDPEGRFVYLAETPSQVRAFDIRSSQGALTAQISVYSFGGEGFNLSIIADASGRNRLYVANTEIGVYGYDMTASTGELTLIQGSPFPGAFSPAGLAMDPQSKFLYATNMEGLDGSVSAFSVNTASGQLTAITGSPFPAGDKAWSVAVDPSGRFAYVAGKDSDEVIAYAINPSTGALTFVGSSFSLGTQPYFVAIEPTGKFAYVADHGSDAVSAYAINQSTGALTQLSGSPFSLGAGTQPIGIAILKIAQ